MIYITEPYLFWKGHYKQYFENLLNHKDTIYLYCDNIDLNYKDSIFIKSSEFNYENSFFAFIKSRIFNSFKLINVLNKKIKSGDTIYFLEFEPFSVLFFTFLNRNEKIKIIQTIHSVDRIKYSNFFKDYVSKIQRFVFIKTLSSLCKFDTTFIVHYTYHYDSLTKILNNEQKINIIDYPSPELKVNTINKLSKNKSLLIFGLVREDKGIYDFLERVVNLKLNLQITIAGKILDNRVNKFKNIFTFIDKFLDNNEISELYDTHDFALIPYGNKYTGGAGPLNDAFAYGKFVIASKHQVFNNLIVDNSLGIVFNDVKDLPNYLDNIDEETYQNISKNCLNYAKNNTWEKMRNQYLSLSEGTL